MLYLDTDSRKQLADEHAARLAADYDRTPSSPSPTLSRLVFLTIALAAVAAIAVATAQARVTPSARQTANPPSSAPAASSGVAGTSSRANGRRIEPLTTLRVIVRTPASAPVERHVVCPTWVPAPDEACGEARLVLRITREHPRPCLDIWGGPATADIRGFVDGHRVRLHLTRSNSCEIARWTQLRVLLGPPTRRQARRGGYLPCGVAALHPEVKADPR